MNVWTELGIAPGSEVREVKLAYARRIKQVHPEDDPEGFQRLRQAYEVALRMAQARAAQAAAQSQSPPNEPLRHDDVLPAGEYAAPVQPPHATVQTPVSPEPSQPRATATPSLEPPPTANPDLARPPPPAQAAQLLFEQMLSMPQAQWPDVLTATRRRPGWENLDFQVALERAVVRGLTTGFDRLFPLIKVFATHYGWQQAHNHLRQADPAVATLWQRYAARQRRMTMQAQQTIEKSRRQALVFLFKPVDETAFKRFARWSRNLRAMRALLQQLQSGDRAVLQYEVNASSANWWLKFLQAPPRTWDHWLGLALTGLVFGPVSLVSLAAVIASTTGFDLLRHAAVGLPLMLVSMAAPLGADVLLRRWRQANMTRRLNALRLRWRHERQFRRIAIGLTALVVALTAGAGSLPYFGAFVVLSGLLTWFWSDWRRAVAATMVFAWPLQLPLSMLLDVLLRHIPAAEHTFDRAALLLWFPHCTAMLLTEPFKLGCSAIYRKLRGKPPRDPVKLSFAAMILLAALSVIAAIAFKPDGQTGGGVPVIRRDPLPKTDAVAAPTAPVSLGDYVSLPLPLPPPPPPPATPLTRSDKELENSFSQYGKAFNAVFFPWFMAHPNHKAETLVLDLLVAPDGKVIDCQVKESGYHDRALEQQLVAAAKTVKFTALPNGPTQRVTIGWGKKPPAHP